MLCEVGLQLSTIFVIIYSADYILDESIKGSENLMSSSGETAGCKHFALPYPFKHVGEPAVRWLQNMCKNKKGCI